MIRIHRGSEPGSLTTLRATKLALFKTLATDPDKKYLKGYDIVKSDLCQHQHEKCCYCEMGIQSKHNDVDHYRPKARAERGPHHSETYGYWWLTFTWENLLLACANCNRGQAKGSRFPLEKGCVPLARWEQPPEKERPLIIDPALECGIQHIQFRCGSDNKWRPFGRTERGFETIKACRLDSDSLVKHYTKHVDLSVLDRVKAVQKALVSGNASALRECVANAQQCLLQPRCPFVGLSYDALQFFVPGAELKPFGLAWKPPA